MPKDRVVTGMIVGLLANSVKLLSNYIAYQFGYTQVVFWQLVAARFMTADQLSLPSALLVGAVADLTMAALIGVVFAFLVRFVGPDYLWIKGIGLAMAAWAILFSTLLSQDIQPILNQQPSDIIVTIIAHFMFGLALAFFGSFLLAEFREDNVGE